MKCLDKYDQNDNKQTVDYPTDMKPEEAYFIFLLRVIVATMPHGWTSSFSAYSACSAL